MSSSVFCFPREAAAVTRFPARLGAHEGTDTVPGEKAEPPAGSQLTPRPLARPRASRIPAASPDTSGLHIIFFFFSKKKIHICQLFWLSSGGG